MNKVVNINEAIIAYINGKKVRRYFKDKDENTFIWFNNWIWFENNECKQLIYYDNIQLLNPLYSFDKFGSSSDKLWEIQE